MKGVAGNGNVSLQALKAGNDMVLSPRNLKEEIPAVLEAIEKGELTREDIESKCRKVLTYKYVLGLKKKSYVQLSGLEQRINSPQTRDWFAVEFSGNNSSEQQESYSPFAYRQRADDCIARGRRSRRN